MDKKDLIEMRSLDRTTYGRLHMQMKRGVIERIVIDGRLYVHKNDINKTFYHLRGRKAKK